MFPEFGFGVKWIVFTYSTAGRIGKQYLQFDVVATYACIDQPPFNMASSVPGRPPATDAERI